MPVSDAQVDELLAQPPEAPTRLDGAPVRQRHVSAELARARRQAVSQLMAAGTGNDEIIRLMGLAQLRDPATQVTKPGFALTEQQTMHVMLDVQRMWDHEDATRGEMAKSASIRRHHDHIQKASKKGAYTAVAMLESNLSKIEGTNEPLRIEVNDGARMTDAVLRVLGDVDPAKLRALVDKQRIIEANGVEVKKLGRK